MLVSLLIRLIDVVLNRMGAIATRFYLQPEAKYRAVTDRRGGRAPRRIIALNRASSWLYSVRATLARRRSSGFGGWAWTAPLIVTTAAGVVLVDGAPEPDYDDIPF